MAGVFGWETDTRQVWRGHCPARGTAADHLADTSQTQLSDFSMPFFRKGGNPPGREDLKMTSFERIPRITFPILALALALWAGGYLVRGVDIASVLRELQNFSFHMNETSTRDVTVGGQHSSQPHDRKRHRMTTTKH
jgi:hypothetical protein